MRTFELITIIVSVITIFIPYLLSQVERKFFLPAFTIPLIASILQVLIEGFRILLIPVYIVALFIFIRELRHLLIKHEYKPKESPGAKVGSIILRILGTILVGTSVLFILAFPIHELKSPTGPFEVGTVKMDFEDTSREEIFTDDPDDYRNVTVRFWYPAENTRGLKRLPFIENPEQSLKAYVDFQLSMMLGSDTDLSFLFENLKFVKTNAFINPPLASAEKEYPVIFFSHGFGGVMNQNYGSMEHLASHGYIVASLSHAYEAAMYVNAQGTVISGTDSNSYGKIETKMMENLPFVAKKISSNMHTLTRSGNLEAVESLYMNILEGFDRRSLRIWTDDTLFIADRLEALNQGGSDSIFKGRIKTGSYGIFGHSFGGATAAQVCAEDSRFKAGANLDGIQAADLMGKSLDTPFMFVRGSFPFLHQKWFRAATGDRYRLTMDQLNHFEFSSAGSLLPIMRQYTYLTPPPPDRINHILNDYLGAFFDKYLRGIPSKLLDGENRYPEAELEFKR